MLIIFDLDDTLIQTSAMITPWKIRSVFKKLLDQKKINGTLSFHLEQWKDFYKTYPTSTEGLSAYLLSFGCEMSVIEEAVKTFKLLDPEIPVEVFDGVHSLLLELKKKYRLALVTSGALDHQTLKIQKAGFDKNYFDHVEIAVDLTKKAFYEKIHSIYNTLDVWVVGDRIERDLLPAKELGFKTVLVKQGRGLYQNFNSQCVDYAIEDVRELLGLVKSLTIVNDKG